MQLKLENGGCTPESLRGQALRQDASCQHQVDRAKAVRRRYQPTGRWQAREQMATRKNSSTVRSPVIGTVCVAILKDGGYRLTHSSVFRKHPELLSELTARNLWRRKSRLPKAFGFLCGSILQAAPVDGAREAAELERAEDADTIRSRIVAARLERQSGQDGSILPESFREPINADATRRRSRSVEQPEALRHRISSKAPLSGTRRTQRDIRGVPDPLIPGAKADGKCSAVTVSVSKADA
jgi:hypothetical protein